MAKTAVVTGASTGIGEATALRLARAGWSVYAGVRRDADGERLVAAAGSGLTPVALDVTDAGQIDAVAELVDAAGGRLDALVNNAGIATGGPVEHLPVDEWRWQMEVNLIGQVAVTKALIPAVRRARGRLVFIGSMSGRLATPLMGPYGASKHAIEAVCEALRHELKPFGVATVLLEPGAVRTPIWEKGRSTADRLEGLIPEEGRADYEPFLAAIRKGIDDQERIGIPADDVAKVVERVLTVAHPRARYPVGRDSQLAAIMTRLLPDRLRDPLVAKVAGP